MTSQQPPGGERVDPADALAVPIEIEPAAAGDLFGTELGVARRYLELLATDGIVRGLIGPRERARLWTRHLLNSVVAAPLLPAEAVVVDIGSGAGLPGIPMAIARGDVLMTLVEPLERRVLFLQEAVEALGLTNCRVLRGRADQVVGDASGADVVTSRAVAPLAKLAGWSVPLLRVGGELMALKGSSAEVELVRDEAALRSLGLTDLRVETLGGPDGSAVTPTDAVAGGTGAAETASGGAEDPELTFVVRGRFIGGAGAVRGRSRAGGGRSGSGRQPAGRSSERHRIPPV